MSEADLREAAHKFERIGYLKEQLKRAQSILAWANKHAKTGEVYPVDVKMKNAERYNDQTEIRIDLDAGVVQQHCVNVVSNLRRQIIQLGGEP